MRLFVSVDLPDALADGVAEAQALFDDAPGLRVTDPGAAHVTLKFLGEVDDDRLPSLEDALDAAVESAGLASFRATFGGLGVFPSLDYIRVVWLGVREGEADLGRLHEAVEAATVERGFDPADHDFTPHVTLARMENAAGKEIVQHEVASCDPVVGSMCVDEVRLTASELGDAGPTYSTVHRVPLDG